MSIHCAPALKVTNTPASVPTYSLGVGCVNNAGVDVGSMMTVLTGTLGRFPRTDDQVALAVVWPEHKPIHSRSPENAPAERLGPPGNPPTAAYTVVGWRGSTASRLTMPCTGLNRVQTCPPLVERQMLELSGHGKFAISGRH